MSGAVARVIAGFVLGGIAGSFLSTLAIRWMRGERVSRGRSQCDGCRVAIDWRWNVPLISYALLRGRCPNCRVALDPRHPLLELGCALIGAAALAIYPTIAGLLAAVAGWLLATLALLDWAVLWLPDPLVGALALIGIAAGVTGQPPPGLDHLIGAVAGYASLTLIRLVYRHLRGREGLGGGDPKLLGAIGAWLGWALLPWVVLIAAALGLGLAGAQALRGRTVRATDRLPFGTLLACAAWPLWLAVTAGWLPQPG